MLKSRLIPVLLMLDGRMVKGKQFKDYRETGLPTSTVRIYSAQDADELCFININSDPQSFQSMAQILAVASKECFIPLCAGGGVRTLDDIKLLFSSGADKVLITSACYKDPELIQKAVNIYGGQSIVAGIDFTSEDSSIPPQVFIDMGNTPVQIPICDYAKLLESYGVGEIFLNSISRDGLMIGYDLDVSQAVQASVEIPVITCGGAGNFEHLLQAYTYANVSAAACASLFHFGDNTPIRARAYLKNHGVLMRALK